MITAVTFNKVGIKWLEDSDGGIARLFGDDALRLFGKLYSHCDAVQPDDDAQITLDDRHLVLCEVHGWHPSAADDAYDNETVIFRFSEDDARLVIVTEHEDGLTWASEFDVEVERRNAGLVIRNAIGLIVIEL